jgi:predicted Zn-dependent protease
MREKDLKFLSKDPLYAPFCQALLLMKNGKKDAACDILEKADAKNNLPLLFFAAKTLGENGRTHAALNKYALFPENSSFRLAVLLNTAELYAENGNPAHALVLARKAYNMAPELPETQFCYADKLRKNGNLSEIPDVIKLTRATIYRKELEQLYISGMEARIKMTDAGKSPEKLRQLCETLLRIDSSNGTAAAALSKIRKTVYDKMNPGQQNLNRRE